MQYHFNTNCPAPALPVCPAWWALSTQARALYIELRRRYNGQIAFSVRDGTDLCRMNRDAVATLFKALERLGLVELATPGSFSRKVRHAAEWRLTTDICDATGAVPFKAFMRWRPRLARFTVPPLPRRIYSSHRPCFFRGGEWIANDGHSATAADGFSVAIARAHEGALEVYSF
jgi:hypothetical protein